MALTNEARKVFRYDDQITEAKRLVTLLKAAGAKNSWGVGEGETVLDFAESRLRQLRKERTDYKISHGMSPCGH